jgi:hypothetical protein
MEPAYPFHTERRLAEPIARSSDARRVKANRPRGGPQQLVAGLVTVLVGESFEVVKVDHGHGQGVPAWWARPISTGTV